MRKYIAKNKPAPKPLKAAKLNLVNFRDATMRYGVDHSRLGCILSGVSQKVAADCIKELRALSPAALDERAAQLQAGTA